MKRPLLNMRPQDLKAMSIGLELSVVIGGMAWGGHWLDETLGTGPLWLLTGSFVGIFGGCWHAMKMANGGKLPDMGLTPKPKPKPKPKPNPKPGTVAPNPAAESDPPDHQSPEN